MNAVSMKLRVQGGAPSPSGSVRRAPKWHLIYYLLAFFDLATVSGSLYLNHQIMAIYTNSVDVNQRWAGRLAGLGDLGQLAGAVNAPGNDIFDSGNGALEEKRQKDALADYERHYAQLHDDIVQGATAEQAVELHARLDAIEAAMGEMLAEADLIFAYFRTNQATNAGRHMASMDRKFANLSTAIAAAAQSVRAIQSGLFTSQVAAAVFLRKYEYLFGGMILLMVGCVTIYGHKIASEFKRSEAERSRYLDALRAEEANKLELERKLRQSQKMDALGTLAGGIAHDFNNMLMVMDGYVGRASKRLDDPVVVAKSLRGIGGSIAAASKLVRQLSLAGGRRALEARVFEVSQLKDDIDGLIQITAGRHQRIEYDFRQDARVKTDRSELTQAVLNLATNAIHASSPGSVIRISVDTADIADGFTGAQPPLAPGRYVVIAVADRGTGIPDQILARIFEPFFTTKAEGKGTGLGLSMVYGFAEQSGGGVGVTTKIGQGSTFSIYLPVSELPAEALEARDASIPRGHGESILLVDDDAQLVELTGEVLRELGYVVHAATDAFAAVELADDGDLRIDLMLSDVVMPVMTGPEAYNIIKSDRPGLPVIFMSGDTNRFGDVTLPENAKFLPKPVTTPVLAAAIRSVLDGDGPKAPVPAEKQRAFA
jgi:signal transduction histidine kinase